MISAKKLIPCNSMSADTSGSAQLTYSGLTSESPKSAIAKANNKIWIKLKDLIAETVQLVGKGSADISGWK